MTVVGWVDSWNDDYPVTAFTTEKHKALVERVRKRRYNFSYQMFMNPYTTPVYSDGTKSLLTKSEWDKVLADAYSDDKMPVRCTPMDVLTIKKNNVLWEKEKFIQEMAGDKICTKQRM